jgi:hypothetical protein
LYCRGGRRSGGPDQIDVVGDELARVSLEFVYASFAVPYLVMRIAAFLIAEIGHALEERSDQMAGGGGGADRQHADAPHFALLLSESAKWGCQRTRAEPNDKLATIVHPLSFIARSTVANQEQPTVPIRLGQPGARAATRSFSLPHTGRAGPCCKPEMF